MTWRGVVISIATAIVLSGGVPGCQAKKDEIWRTDEEWKPKPAQTEPVSNAGDGGWWSEPKKEHRAATDCGEIFGVKLHECEKS
jgi:hypothetical protein